MPARKQLSLKVAERDKIIFQGSIVSLTSYNDKGKFDVLDMHANFISLVNKSLEIELPDGEKRIIQIKDGVLRVVDNDISVYLGVKF